jgi:hypothetical protein
MKKNHYVLLLFLFSCISIYGQSFSTESWWSPETQKFSEYKFDIDGLKVLDYKNPQVKVGTEVYGSVVEVCASVPRFDQYVHAGSEVDVIKKYF